MIEYNLQVKKVGIKKGLKFTGHFEFTRYKSSHIMDDIFSDLFKSHAFLNFQVQYISIDIDNLETSNPFFVSTIYNKCEQSRFVKGHCMTTRQLWFHSNQFFISDENSFRSSECYNNIKKQYFLLNDTIKLNETRFTVIRSKTVSKLI